MAIEILIMIIYYDEQLIGKQDESSEGRSSRPFILLLWLVIQKKVQKKVQKNYKTRTILNRIAVERLKESKILVTTL